MIEIQGGSSGYLLNNAIAPVLSVDLTTHGMNATGQNIPPSTLTWYRQRQSPMFHTCASKEEARGELEHKRTLADEHTLGKPVKQVSGGRFRLLPS